MFNRVMIALLTVLAVAGFGTVSEPAAAKTCEAVLAKGRGLDEAAASARSLKHLKNRINHWAAEQARLRRSRTSLHSVQ